MAREEAGREPPYGPALDLGTGSAVWGVQLARRGWRVTGVDIVEKALRRARERIDKAGVEMRLVHGDVTALRGSDIGSDFRLVVDTGTFHGLTDAQREAMGREVTAVCATREGGARLLRAQGTGGPLPRGGAAPTWSMRSAVEDHDWKTATPNPTRWPGSSRAHFIAGGVTGAATRPLWFSSDSVRPRLLERQRLRGPTRVRSREHGLTWDHATLLLALRALAS